MCNKSKSAVVMHNLHILLYLFFKTKWSKEEYCAFNVFVYLYFFGLYIGYLKRISEVYSILYFSKDIFPLWSSGWLSLSSIYIQFSGQVVYFIYPHSQWTPLLEGFSQHQINDSSTASVGHDTLGRQLDQLNDSSSASVRHGTLYCTGSGKRFVRIAYLIQFSQEYHVWPSR
jgi:hypothetical protein